MTIDQRMNGIVNQFIKLICIKMYTNSWVSWFTNGFFTEQIKVVKFIFVNELVKHQLPWKFEIRASLNLEISKLIST